MSDLDDFLKECKYDFPKFVITLLAGLAIAFILMYKFVAPSVYAYMGRKMFEEKRYEDGFNAMNRYVDYVVDEQNWHHSNRHYSRRI